MVKFKSFFCSYNCKDEEEVERVGVPQEQKIFTFQALISATNNFENKLGQGGFGPVFKGKLYDGREIAVKKLSETSKQGKREFTNEAKLLACIQHRNVVSLLGFCAIPEKLLVYEYVANESLDKLLFKSEKRHVLDWKRRYSIIVGVAQGLLYLHEDSHDRIIHRDIKASNILLDQKWRPKIADFGMARLYPEDKTHVTTRVAGTNGYMAPEYAMHGNLSVKSDVYSYGVVVLELISGQKNSTFSLDPECQNLLDWAFKLYEKGKAVEIMDPTLATSADPDQVVVMLSKQSGTLDEPTKPGFEGTKTRKPQRPSSSSSTSGSLSQADSRSSRPSNTTFTSSTSNAHHNTLRSSFVSSVSDPKALRSLGRIARTTSLTVGSLRNLVSSFTTHRDFINQFFSLEKPENKTDDDWTLLHRQVCSYIRQWMDDNVLNHVVGEVHAHTLWIKLEQLYARKTGNSKPFLIKQLISLRYRDRTAISDHLNIFQGVINQLSEMGIKFDEEVQGLWLLGTLTDSWETLRTSFSNSAQDGIISIKLAKNSGTSKDIALSIKENKNNNHGKKNEDGTSDEHVATTEDFLIIYEDETISLGVNEETWVVDTGASSHATPYRDFFISYTPGDFGSVKMGNGLTSKIVGIGDVCMETGVNMRLVLKGVKHIPDLRLNLISTGKLDDDGFYDTFNNGKWRLSRGVMVIARGQKFSNLYLTQAKICKEKINAAELEDKGNWLCRAEIEGNWFGVGEKKGRDKHVFTPCLDHSRELLFLWIPCSAAVTSRVSCSRSTRSRWAEFYELLNWAKVAKMSGEYARVIGLCRGVSVWEGAEAVHLQAEEIKLEYSRNIVTNSRVTPSWREIVSLTVLVKLASYT
nr:putative receptor-like protein kinase At4g00960 [Tanacetum cinerariifolium]